MPVHNCHCLKPMLKMSYWSNVTGWMLQSHIRMKLHECIQTSVTPLRTNLIKSERSAKMVYWIREHNLRTTQFLLGRGVIGNTPDFGSGDSRFDPWRPSHFLFVRREGLQIPLTSAMLHFMSLPCQCYCIIIPIDSINCCTHKPCDVTAVAVCAALHRRCPLKDIQHVVN